MNAISRFGCCVAFLSLVVSGPASTQMPSASRAEATSSQAETARVAQVTGRAPDCKAASLSSAEVEGCKLQLQQNQYELDRKKRDDERAASLLTGVALVASALAGFGAIVFNLVTANRQARLQAQLKALEVVMAASGPNSARQRLDVVGQLLGAGLVTDKEMVIEGVGTGYDESRSNLLKLLAEHPDRRQQILADWAIVFDKTKLSPNIEQLQDTKAPSSAEHAPASPQRRQP